METDYSSEFKRIQNPAFGAILIWKFFMGFQQAPILASPPSLALAFIVLPILLNRSVSDILMSTQAASGIRLFADKLGASVTLIHNRAQLLTLLTLESLQLATSRGLIVIDPINGAVTANLLEMSDSYAQNRSERLVRSAHKLGYWCAQLTLDEVGTILQVDF